MGFSHLPVTTCFYYQVFKSVVRLHQVPGKTKQLPKLAFADFFLEPKFEKLFKEADDADGGAATFQPRNEILFVLFRPNYLEGNTKANF